MKKLNALSYVLLLSLFLSTAAIANLDAFPDAEEGMVRYVLELPEQNDESNFKVELIIGKTVQTDAANRYFFVGSIEEVDIEGWGYTRYVVQDLGPMAGTLMAADPDAPKVDRFITLGGDAYLIRYNSRLPVVIYVPEGVEVGYRIWSTEEEMSLVEQG